MVILIFWIFACFLYAGVKPDRKWWTPEYDELCQAQTPDKGGKYQARMRQFNRNCSVYCYFQGELVRGNVLKVPDGISCKDDHVCQEGSCVANKIVDVCVKLYNTSDVVATEGTCKQICSKKDKQGLIDDQQKVDFQDGTPCLSFNVKAGQCIKGYCKNITKPITTARPKLPRNDVTGWCEKAYHKTHGLVVGKEDLSSHGCKYHCYQKNKQLTKKALLKPNGYNCGNNKDYSCNEGSCQPTSDIRRCSNKIYNRDNGRILVRNFGCKIQCQILDNAGRPGKAANWNLKDTEKCFVGVGMIGLCVGGTCYENAQ